MSLLKEKPSQSSREGFFLGSLVIGAVIFMLYSVAFGHNFLFDEENIILRNPLIRSFSMVPKIFEHGYFYFEGRPNADWAQYYRPLTSLTFTLDYALWKVDPLGYNLTNTSLHVLVSVLFFQLLLKLLQSKTAAFLSALLYSAHTLHTEAVTYIASRGDLLGAALMLGALLCYGERRVKTAVIFYALALFAKESSLLLFLYVLLLDICFVKSGWKVLLKNLLPFLGVACLYLLFRKFYCPIPLGPPTHPLREALLRVFSMGAPILSYFQAVIFPEAFKFCQSVRFAANAQSPQVLKTFFVFLLLGVAWLLSWKRRGAVLFGMSVFLIGLSPYLQVIHFYPEWAEHYLYIPSMGLAILFGCFLENMFKTNRRPVILGLLILVASFFSFLCFRTWQRNEAYNDTWKYYQLLAKSDSPYAFYGYQNLARLAIEHGAWNEAIVPLKTAEAIEPHSDVTQNLLGLYYLEKNEAAEAVRRFRNAYRFNPADTTYLMNAAVVLIRRGEAKEAVEFLEEIQKTTPRYLAVYTNLIAAYELSGRPREALEWGRKGLEALKGRESEAVVLRMSLVRLAWRQGWGEVMKENLEAILQDTPEAFWYGDVARLLIGSTTPDEFLELARTKYPGFKSMAQISVLTALVLRERWDLIPDFLASNKEALEKQAAGHPLVRKELELIKRALEKNTKRVASSSDSF